jgi:hypothetical protein
MKELSPAAQAVLDAVIEQWDADRRPIASPLAAAVLRAAADQVVPEEPPHPLANSPEAKEFGTPEEWMYTGIERDARQEARAKFLAIAAELDLPTSPPVA